MPLKTRLKHPQICPDGGKADPQCPLGCHCVGSLRHILNACCRGEEKNNGKEGMEGQWRVTWRHDSVLLAISKAVLKVINRFKNTQAEAKRGRHLGRSHSKMPRGRHINTLRFELQR